MTQNQGNEPIEVVDLIEGEYVVAGGTKRVRWQVRIDEVWTRSRQVTDCRVESRDAGPGTVWESAVTVRLPRGTELERVEQHPKARRRGGDLFDYVAREVRSAERAERRTRFVVGTRGQLRRRKEGP